jgi:hypothetical protein
MGKSRPQQYRITWPLTASQVEAIDQMFETLYRTVRDIVVSTSQIIGIIPVTSGGTGLSSINQGDILYGSATNVISTLPKSTSATRYLANTGSANAPNWDQVNLTNGVTGDLPYANLTPSSAASKLLGRGDSGAGDWQEITLGSGLTMTGTTLASSGSSSTAYEPLTNGDTSFPEIVFAGGDVVMVVMT